MQFEWDFAKSELNKKKHGISFADALILWQADTVVVEEIAYAKLESRSATLGIIGQKVYVAIWTRRKDKIRLITVRRARHYEEKLYKEKFQIS
jgi:uncharacterized DUF497 family protein